MNATYILCTVHHHLHDPVTSLPCVILVVMIVRVQLFFFKPAAETIARSASEKGPFKVTSVQIKHLPLEALLAKLWSRSSRVVRASDCQCRIVATALGSIPASSHTVESEGGRWSSVEKKYINKKNPKSPCLGMKSWARDSELLRQVRCCVASQNSRGSYELICSHYNEKSWVIIFPEWKWNSCLPMKRAKNDGKHPEIINYKCNC